MVYSGAQLDVDLMFHGMCCPMPNWIGRIVGIVDFPFSIVADTLILPYTITQTLTYRDPSDRNTSPSDQIVSPAEGDHEQWKVSSASGSDP